MSLSRRTLLAGTGLTLAAASLSGCGTILYPERKGQIDGELDSTVLILDGIGLLLFLVPGVIAFAVDFSNGTIYLPGTQKTRRRADVKEVPFSGDLTEARLDRAWTETYGYKAPFEIRDLERRPLNAANLRTELGNHAGAQVFAV